MSKVITLALSLAISACIYYGNENVSQFAFYVSLAFNVIAWIGFPFVVANQKELAKVMEWLPIKLAVAAIGWYVLIHTGHTALAASSVTLSFLIILCASQSKKVAA